MLTGFAWLTYIKVKNIGIEREMKRLFPYDKSCRGFTLIEIIIVAALISLFSGLATFGVQQMLKNNKLKAVIGETRQVGQSLIFAHEDLGYYPKIGFMALSRDLVDVRYGWDRIDSMGFALSSTKGQFTFKNWKGPYFAASQSRNQLSTRYKQLVTMRLHPQYQGLDNEMAWPADQWGNPYVLYLFRYDKTEDTWQFIETLGQQPDYFAAVVSYGPNSVPGAPVGTQTVDDLRAACLYIQQDTRGSVFDALESAEYDQTRRQAYSKAPGGIGIVDPGSDDIIYNID